MRIFSRRHAFDSSSHFFPTKLLTMDTARTMSSPAVRAALATVDLSKYDAEQSRLMDERCILVDKEDNAIGAADKRTCRAILIEKVRCLTSPSCPGHLMENINNGLLHRAFSAFVFHPADGKLLLQQRASSKITFPDMWTNTCCSHPLADFEEEMDEEDQRGVRVAASRKLEHELGIPKKQTPVDQFQYLTRIHYLAPSNDLWGEHEGKRPIHDTHKIYTIPIVDYILFITADVTVTPNPNEVRDYRWVDKAEIQDMFEDQCTSCF